LAAAICKMNLINKINTESIDTNKDNLIEETLTADYNCTLITTNTIEIKTEICFRDINEKSMFLQKILVTKRFTVRGRCFVSFSRSSLDKFKSGLQQK